ELAAAARGAVGAAESTPGAHAGAAAPAETARGAGGAAESTPGAHAGAGACAENPDPGPRVALASGLSSARAATPSRPLHRGDGGERSDRSEHAGWGAAGVLGFRGAVLRVRRPVRGAPERLSRQGRSGPGRGRGSGARRADPARPAELAAGGE